MGKGNFGVSAGVCLCGNAWKRRSRKYFLFVWEWRSRKNVPYQRERWYYSVPVNFLNSGQVPITKNIQIFIERNKDSVHVTILDHFCTSTAKLHRTKITINCGVSVYRAMR